MSDSLLPHEQQYARLPCPSVYLGVCSNWHPLSPNSMVIPSNYLMLCHPVLLHSNFPAWRSFPMSQFFTSGSQSIRASASASVFPVNIQGWFPLGLTGLITLQSKESINSLVLSLLYGPTLTSIHDYLKNHSFDKMDFYSANDISAF